jgi:hypothetical protein
VKSNQPDSTWCLGIVSTGAKLRRQTTCRMHVRATYYLLNLVVVFLSPTFANLSLGFPDLVCVDVPQRTERLPSSLRGFVPTVGTPDDQVPRQRTFLEDRR